MRIADPMRICRRLLSPAVQSTGRNTVCLLVMGQMLGGCMTLGSDIPPPVAMVPTPPPATVEPPPAPGPAVAVEELPALRVVQVSRTKNPERKTRQSPQNRAPREKPASIDPDRLIGLEPSGVRKLLGAPAHVRTDDLYREWIYAASGCSFRVFFYPYLNTTSFLALKYGSDDGNGELINTSDVCIRNILIGKNNATD